MSCLVRKCWLKNRDLEYKEGKIRPSETAGAVATGLPTFTEQCTWKLHCPDGATYSQRLSILFMLREAIVSIFTMKMQAAVPTQMSANLYQMTPPHLQENRTLPNHGHENAKYCKFGDISKTSNVTVASTHGRKAHEV